VAFVYLLGQIVTRVRLSAAHVPVDAALATTTQNAFFGAGVQAALLMTAVFAGVSAVAHTIVGWRWSATGPAWRLLIVGDGKVAARDNIVRVVAGYDIFVVAGVLSLLVSSGEAPFTNQLSPGGSSQTTLFWVDFAVLVPVLVSVGPGRIAPLVRPVALGMIVAALLCLAPIGLLVVAGVATSAMGRTLARHPRLPRSLSELVMTPYPYALMAIYTLVAVAKVAIPPVAFPHAVIATTEGQVTGGYLTRNSDGVALVVCAPLANATSTDQHIVFIESKEIKHTTLSGSTYQLDNGQRPSLATVALNAIGFSSQMQALLPNIRFHPSRPSCANEAAPRQIASEMPALGSGVLVGPGPGSQAHNGEPPIEETTPKLAALARRYQPTVEVTAADRFWPVSVQATLNEVGPKGEAICLNRGTYACSVSHPSLGDLSGPSAPSDYLRFPAALSGDPTEEFDAFVRGQQGIGQEIPSTEQWLTDPSVIDPWYTAQVYFYYAGPANPSRWPTPNSAIPAGLIALQYWFYYPYHYYPTLVATRLMNEAPLAGDLANADVHQGDWQHVTVLLEPTTLKPRWLYMARHSNEGEYYPWNSPSLTFDDGHPIVQAAYGGHDPYDNNCGQRPRHANGLKGLVSDWIVCGSGRFAFRAATTPLVDIAKTPWACWKGHFGFATAPELTIDENYLDAGPSSPLWQGENGHLASDGFPANIGPCANHDPEGPERAAISHGIATAITRQSETHPPEE
jgi:hypothetical protein